MRADAVSRGALVREAGMMQRPLRVVGRHDDYHAGVGRVCYVAVRDTAGVVHYLRPEAQVEIIEEDT